MTLKVRTAVGAGLVAGLGIIGTASADAPVVEESGWALLRAIDFNAPLAPHFNPMDGLLYVVSSEGGTDGLYRITSAGVGIQLASASDPAALVIDPADGDIFVAEHYGGVIYRTAFGATGRETWVTGFHSGDDDPIGMAIAPDDYSGDVIAPGDALVVDWGNGNADEVWAWSPTVADGEFAVHTDNGTLDMAMDVVVTSTTVYIVDFVGVIYEVAADGTLTPLATAEPINGPMAITEDPLTGDLLVLDDNNANARVVRIDPGSGAVSTVLSGLVLDTGGLTRNWASLDITADGTQLVVSELGEHAIWVYGRCDVIDPDDDCNNNGVLDSCDIALGDALDCNGNGIPDSCDVASGESSDCDGNGIPDECPICPPLEVVFVMDTSSSMSGDAAALCNSIDAIIAQLQEAGIDVSPTLWGVSDDPRGAFDCLTDNVLDALGPNVPGNPPPGLELLGDCPGGNEVPSEDWGLATAIVAGLYPWQSDSVRLIVPLADEGPWCGDPVSDLDNQAIIHAIEVCNAAGVVVSPVTASGSSGAVIALAQQLAAATGGMHFSSTEPDEDLAQGVLDLITDACDTISDCNGNGVPDDCDIDNGTSDDSDGNGIPDECECEADFNLDGVVNVDDLLFLLGAWGDCNGECPADLVVNGVVDVDDLLVLLGAWGDC